MSVNVCRRCGASGHRLQLHPQIIEFIVSVNRLIDTNVNQATLSNFMCLLNVATGH